MQNAENSDCTPCLMNTFNKAFCRHLDIVAPEECRNNSHTIRTFPYNTRSIVESYTSYADYRKCGSFSDPSEARKSYNIIGIIGPGREHSPHSQVIRPVRFPEFPESGYGSSHH